MKRLLADMIICPTCLPEERRLICKVEQERENDIYTGHFQCSFCATHYPIKEGIACLLPCNTVTPPQTASQYETPALVSSYLWSHYADIFNDGDACLAYTQWSSEVKRGSGFYLDAGCAVGRFTFEMSKKYDFVIGLDTSYSFIRAARELLTKKTLSFLLTEEGRLSQPQIIKLPQTWNCRKVEFIRAEARAIPFPSHFFSGVASLNLVDKISRPLVHLKEINRVSRKQGSQFLFSDPFSWSIDSAPEEDWLGGKSTGPYAGKGMDNVASLLRGEKEDFTPPWSIAKRGVVWWKIFNHRNHFELIRSCFLKAER
jgi:SAM-dependent methyltransferase/uncharacterized protein YbaR (Trm112 family)